MVNKVIDVCIVGGGMVGSACALGLAQLGWSVVLLERDCPQAYSDEQLPDLRVSAINLNSEQFFQDLGVWQDIQSMRLCPYRRLSVWEQRDARTDFDCRGIKRPHLGHIIENRIIQLALHQRFGDYTNLRSIYGEAINTIELNQHARVTLVNGETLNARILIGADGANSLVRKAAGIGVQGWQYQQHALGITIKTHGEQQDITWQQFTPQGPVAFLPLFGQYASLVWYNDARHVERLKKLSKKQLKQEIVQHFPAELVDFDIIDWGSFPLNRMHANQYSKANAVLVGDAAHNINPLAGQGVNLGFKDVQVLLDIFNAHRNEFNAQPSAANLSQWFTEYENRRRRDNLLMMSVMDGLYLGFGNNIMPMKFLRNVGLKLANRAGPLKKRALQYAVGFN